MHTCVPTATVHSASYTVNSRVVVGAIYAYMCTYSYHTRCTVHGVPYTVNSRVVVGAIYAYMCTYSYRTWCTVHGVLTCGGGANIHIHVYLQLPYMVHHTRCTDVWWWGQYTHTCVPTATIHGVPYTVNSRVVVGAIYTYMCTYSYRTRCTVHGELMHGGGIHVWELLTCAGDIHVWELLTCETSHQSEILHSLIFLSFRAV